MLCEFLFHFVNFMYDSVLHQCVQFSEVAVFWLFFSHCYFLCWRMGARGVESDIELWEKLENWLDFPFSVSFPPPTSSLCCLHIAVTLKSPDCS